MKQAKNVVFLVLALITINVFAANNNESYVQANLISGLNSSQESHPTSWNNKLNSGSSIVQTTTHNHQFKSCLVDNDVKNQRIVIESCI